MISILENWTELTTGLYRYVIAANCCYELHINYWDKQTDVNTSNASVYVVGEWVDSDGNTTFEREPLLESRPLYQCLRAASHDYEVNVS